MFKKWFLIKCEQKQQKDCLLAVFIWFGMLKINTDTNKYAVIRRHY